MAISTGCALVPLKIHARLNTDHHVLFQDVRAAFSNPGGFVVAKP
jgi:hypothetical protein